MARPVDFHEKVYEVPTVRRVQTFVPKVQVREVVRTIPKEETKWEEKKIEVRHQKIVDKYVEVPIVSGTEVKYVPKVEVRERIVQTSKPEIKWVEKIIEIPQIKEVVRYVESDKNVETVIRYVSKGQGGDLLPGGPGDQIDIRAFDPALKERTGYEGAGGAAFATGGFGEFGGAQEREGQEGEGQGGFAGPPQILTPRSTVPLSVSHGNLDNRNKLD